MAILFQCPFPLVFSAFLIFPAIIPAAPAPIPGSKDTEFIRTSCATTLYPEICYSTLVGQANSIHQNPDMLAVAAVSVGLKIAQRTATYFSSLSRNRGGGDVRAYAALHDCVYLFNDAIVAMSSSIAELKAGQRGQISNVETLMSAALTDIGTCMDGFEEVRSGPLKSYVSNRATYMKKVTSIALSFVTSLATNVGSKIHNG
ncbi:21 kDa protein-like [Tasmannia lanceolata]|uniref:21 kDa protein-like n=1 Tax=Tasmannia lanceolata TaxID=3420 RepID=UPI00406337A3